MLLLLVLVDAGCSVAALVTLPAAATTCCTLQSCLCSCCTRVVRLGFGHLLLQLLLLRAAACWRLASSTTSCCRRCSSALAGARNRPEVAQRAEGALELSLCHCLLQAQFCAFHHLLGL
jgi:hypothetical protein